MSTYKILLAPSHHSIIASFIFFRELRKHPLSIICWAALSDFVFVFAILLKDATGDDLCFLREYGFCVSTFLVRALENLSLRDVGILKSMSQIHTFGMAGVSWAGGALSVKVLVNTVRPFAPTHNLQKWFHAYVAARLRPSVVLSAHAELPRGLLFAVSFGRFLS